MNKSHMVKLCAILTLVALVGFEIASAQDIEPTPSGVKTVQDEKGIWMVYVPEGTFKMGIDLSDAIKMCANLVPEKFVDRVCTEKVFKDFSSLSESQTTTVLPFYIDQFEVSLGDYLACVNADVCGTDFLKQEMEAIASGDNVPMDLPVTLADYYDAAIYCAWRGGTLPTETEWEYAARGSESSNFPWGNDFDGTRLNFCDETCYTAPEPRWDDGFSEAAPVTAFKEGRSWAGIYNLSGNVAEWTSTRLVDVSGFLTDIHVVKGGSFLDYALGTAAWSRSLSPSNGGSPAIGFRCSRTTPP